MSEIQITEISPYFSVISETMPNIKSAALGVFFQHGSRCESSSEQGITHLIEHLLFQKTKQKTAREIALFAESRGAVVDGFTTKELSGIYARFVNSNFYDIIDLISECICEVEFTEETLNKEQHLIIKEIENIEDNPEEYIFILFDKFLFADHPLSYPSVGIKETVSSLKLKQIVDYYYNKYLTSKVCISAAGQIEHNQLVDGAQKLIDLLKLNTKSQIFSKPITKIEAKRIIKRRSDLQQVYSLGGKFTFSYQSEERYGLILLNNIWGGMISSRFFNRLREKEALVYTVTTFLDLYSDIGIIGGFIVMDPTNLKRVYWVGQEELERLSSEGITEEELQRSINYTKSLLIVNNEDPMSRMIRNAKHKLLLNRVVTIDETIAKFEKCSIESINKLTDQLPLKNYIVVNIGDLRHLEEEITNISPTNIIYT